MIPADRAPVESKPTQVEKTGCRKLAEVFPTWVYDGEPETTDNLIDTEESAAQGVVFTAAFEVVCPGALRMWSSTVSAHP